MKIMLVEDNPRVRKMLKEKLQKCLHAPVDILECDDGEQAVDLYHAFQPDWVLMDIKLKSLDGLSATESILRAHAQARVIIVTSYDDPVYREMAKNAGACGYVLKENLSQVIELICA